MKINNKYALSSFGNPWESLLLPLVKRLEEHASVTTGPFPVSPRIRWVEDSTDFFLEIAVPGWDKKELELSFIENRLFLKGSAKNLSEKDPTGDKRLDLRLELPKETRPEQSSAKLTNGVLTIRFPKEKKPSPKTLKIS